MKTILAQQSASPTRLIPRRTEKTIPGRLHRPLFALLLLCAATVHANQATIVAADINKLGDNHNFQVDVTISHADAGWDHYANRWDIFDEKGQLLGTRILHHPHDNEQPFTRSLLLDIPPGVKTITIVASDSVHKANPDTVQLTVPGRSK